MKVRFQDHGKPIAEPGQLVVHVKVSETRATKLRLVPQNRKFGMQKVMHTLLCHKTALGLVSLAIRHPVDSKTPTLSGPGANEGS